MGNQSPCSAFCNVEKDFEALMCYYNVKPIKQIERTSFSRGVVMNCKEFIKSTICSLDPITFEECKIQLLGSYIKFSFIDAKDITRKVFAEKLYDYFETLEKKTNKTFDKRMEMYMSDIDSIVGPHIEKTPKAKKGDETPVVTPRARKYYDKALENKAVKSIKFKHLTDYSRLMFCLYTEIIKSKEETIDNFNFSAECLKPKEILSSMKNEETATVIPHQKKKRFEAEKSYDSDSATMIISILMLWSIINASVQGDADRE